MNDLEFFLAHRYDEDTKQFIPFAYTNVAENVYLTVDSEETVADALKQLGQDVNDVIVNHNQDANAHAKRFDAMQANIDGLSDEIEDILLQKVKIVGPFNTIADIPTPYETNTIYLVGTASPYQMFLYVDGNLIQKGSTEIDLSNYINRNMIGASGGVAATNHSHTAADVGAAPSSHNHNASNITAGTLPLTRGGTGATTAAAARTAIEAAAANHTHTAADVGAAPSSHNHNASDITAGTLPLARGGTGATTAAAARTAIGAAATNHGHNASEITAGTLAAARFANDSITAARIVNVSAIANAVGIGFGATAPQGNSVAIGRNSNANANPGTALGSYAVSTHSYSIVLPAGRNANAFQNSTTTNQCLLTGVNGTPMAHRALSIISDERDKVEIQPLTFDALEFLNKVEPKQYKLDFRSAYVRWEEITEEEFKDLDDYSKKHKAIQIPVYQLDNETEYISLISDEGGSDRFKPIVKSNVFSTENEALATYRTKMNITDDAEIPIPRITRQIRFVQRQLPKDGSFTNNRLHNGVLAQQVKSVADAMGFDFVGFKDHTVNGGDDLFSISYEEFIAPMIGAIQQLTKKIQDLENKLSNQ